MMRTIFIDRPLPGDRVSAGQIFEGWTVSPEPSETVIGTVNGQSVQIHIVPRPDVEAARPGENAKGFMFFFEPETRTGEFSALFRLGNIEREVRFSLGLEDIRAVSERVKVQDGHMRFLRDTLACPKCHLAIRLEEIEGQKWACQACSEAYDCRSGIDLIPESYENKSAIRFGGAICSHGYDAEVEALIAQVESSGGMVLDCGAGWRHQIRPSVITTEILRYPSTDVVAVGEHLPFCDASFDAVLSLHVLEHVKNPFVCAAELARVLKPGGTLYAVTPYIVGVHGFPFHFFNPTPSGLRALFDGRITGVDVAVPTVAHPICALKDLIGVYAQFFEGESRVKFRNVTIGNLLDSSFDQVLTGDLVRTFREDGKNVLAGNYRIVGTKP